MKRHVLRQNTLDVHNKLSVATALTPQNARLFASEGSYACAASERFSRTVVSASCAPCRTLSVEAFHRAAISPRNAAAARRIVDVHARTCSKMSDFVKCAVKRARGHERCTSARRATR